MTDQSYPPAIYWPDLYRDFVPAGLIRFGMPEDEIARRVFGQAYLATPFTARAVFSDGYYCPSLAAAAAADASAAQTRLMRLGVTAVSPVVLGYAACADDFQLNPLDHAEWMAWGRRILDASRCVIVPEIEGWDVSAGIVLEVGYALKGSLPVYVVGALRPETA